MILAYYVGAYGPTIRLDTQTLDELVAVRQLFGRLALGEVLQDDLCKALACHVDAVQSLVVHCAPEHLSKALELKGNGSNGPIFSWKNTSDDWLECEEKVEALISSGSPGHQYLTHEGIDDALVEVCYKEWPIKQWS
jgi:hypothetical protein